MSQPTVIVTGANGFVGSHLVRQLVTRGDRAIVAATHSASTRNLEDLAERVTFAQVDLGNFANVRSTLSSSTNQV